MDLLTRWHEQVNLTLEMGQYIIDVYTGDFTDDELLSLYAARDQMHGYVCDALCAALYDRGLAHWNKEL